MAHATMEAMLADHRMLEEIDAVTEAWDILAGALSAALEGRPDAGAIERAEAQLLDAERRASVEIRAALDQVWPEREAE